MKLMHILVVGSLLISSPAMADVSLRLPEGIKLVATNGKKAKIYRHTNLPDGINQIALQYEGEFGKDINDSDMEYSHVFVVTFDAADAKLEMKSPNVRRKSHVENFNKNPNITIVDQHGTVIPTAIGKLEKEGFQLMRDYERELEEFNVSGSPAAVPPGTTSQAASQSKTVQPKSVKVKKPYTSTNTVKEMPQQPQAGGQPEIPEQMLKYWYEQADEETKERFKEWVDR